jgi:hypothetical protein
MGVGMDPTIGETRPFRCDGGHRAAKNILIFQMVKVSAR